MDRSTWFPEKDKCTKVCENIAAYRKSTKNPEELSVELKKDNEVDQGQEILPAAEINPNSYDLAEVCATNLQFDINQFQDSLNLTHDQDGKIDWTPLKDLTGIRPPVNNFSTNRYSLSEWRKHNSEMLNTSTTNEANIAEYNGRTSIMQAFGNVDSAQLENNKRLKQKAKDIFRWKVEVETACKAITEEIDLLEIAKQRLLRASRVLMSPESISRECLDLRNSRFESSLVFDPADKELILERTLVNEVRNLLDDALDDVNKQMTMNRAAKHKIEYDWCDKATTYETETVSLSLNTKSNTLMFRPGSVKFGEFTASLQHWDFFCKDNMQNCEAVRQKSADLRYNLNLTLIKNGKMLRAQADNVDVALAETAAITKELCTKLEENLRDTLHRTADLEVLIDELKLSIRKLDVAMKLAQTRLDNRNNGRPHGEKVRDQVHLGLIAEVKKIHETVTSLLGQLKNAERLRQKLMTKRRELEKEVASKRHALIVDKQRCGMVRSHYPTALALAGF